MSSRRRILMGASTLKSKGVINGVIQDDLKTLIKICKSGKADQYYSVGDHVSIPLDGFGTFYFDYLGSGLENRADGKNKPVSSWLCRTIPTTYVWNSNHTTDGGWGSSTIRNFCETVMFNSFPDLIKDNIVEVSKVSNNVTTADKIWIPSYEEINNIYQARFPNGDSRKKIGASYWWLRSFCSINAAYCIGSSGSIYDAGSSTSIGLVPGFCL